MPGVVASVGNQRFGARSRSPRSSTGNSNRLHQRLQVWGVMALAGGKTSSERHSANVANEMDLGRQPASGAPEGLIGRAGIPFFTGAPAAARLPRTEVESTIHVA